MMLRTGRCSQWGDDGTIGVMHEEEESQQLLREIEIPQAIIVLRQGGSEESIEKHNRGYYFHDNPCFTS